MNKINNEIDTQDMLKYRCIWYVNHSGDFLFPEIVHRSNQQSYHYIPQSLNHFDGQ